MACFSLAEVLWTTQAIRACLGRETLPPSTPEASLPQAHASHEVVFSSVSTDTRTLQPGALFIALQGANHDGQAFVAQAAQKGAKGAVVLHRFVPQAPLPADFFLLEVENSLKALGQLAHLHRTRNPIPLGAITGSNGKSTTKALVASILKQRGKALATEGNLNNEIGLPLTLLGLCSEHWAGVVEMGMSGPGEISRLAAIAAPQAGLITSIHEAHLEGVGSLEAVAQAKGELFEALPAEATALICADEPHIVEQAKRCKALKLHYGKTADADLRLAKVALLGLQGQHLHWEWRGQTLEAHLHVLGKHNALNATAALAMGLALGCEVAECLRGLEAARAMPRRLSVRQGHGGTLILDDCYNANPASMQAAIYTAAQLASPKRPILVLGDMRELGESEAQAHSLMGALAAQYARLAIFIGPRMHLAWEKARPHMGEAALWFEKTPEATEGLLPLLRPAEVVLVKASRSMRLERIVEALSLSEGEKEGEAACCLHSIPS
ncbi:MAG: UDP-N-acetylmuramoyl-tripeptide--D-alanyl-D-alanine ligase [Cystobacterineae bacterium]|nr:UDP-N-acetylmuramoyl-tripeptide--D-alanyl-D-alanine ligase [Cystobacterineae bacterium]